MSDEKITQPEATETAAPANETAALANETAALAEETTAAPANEATAPASETAAAASETAAPASGTAAPSKFGFGSKLLGEARKAKEQAQAKASGLAGKAGELTSQAATKAGELKGQAATKAGELKGQAAAKAGEVKDQVAAKAAELKDASLAKLFETLDDFNAALPILREAGYSLAGVEIQLGIPPKIVAGFSASTAVTEEHVEALLKEHAEKKFTVLLMRALYQAWRVQMKIKIVGLKPTALEVEIGLTPSVTVTFTRV